MPAGEGRIGDNLEALVRRAKVATRAVTATKRAELYRHEEKAILRSDAGTQAQLRGRRSPDRLLRTIYYHHPFALSGRKVNA